MNSAHDQTDPFGLFSMRQVVGGCLDWVQEALKIILSEYIVHGNPPLNPKFDINLVILITFRSIKAFSLKNGT